MRVSVFTCSHECAHVRLHACVHLIAATEVMIHLTVTCQLIQTTELFGRDSSAPCRALEGGWEQLITHTGWGWLLGYCILGPGSKNRSAVALGKGRAAGRNVMKTCGHHWFSTFWTCMQTTPCFTLAQQHAWTQHWLINTLSAISHWDAPVSLEFDLNFLWQAHLICFLRFFVFFLFPRSLHSHLKC